MDHQGISQRELARRVGVDQKWVQRRLTGVIEFRPSDIEAVATALDVPLSRFLVEVFHHWHTPHMAGRNSGPQPPGDGADSDSAVPRSDKEPRSG